MFKKLISIILCILAVFTLTACTVGGTTGTTEAPETGDKSPDYSKMVYSGDIKLAETRGGKEDITAYLAEVAGRANIEGNNLTHLFRVIIAAKADGNGTISKAEIDALCPESVRYTCTDGETGNEYPLQKAIAQIFAVLPLDCKEADAIEALLLNPKVEKITLNYISYTETEDIRSTGVTDYSKIHFYTGLSIYNPMTDKSPKDDTELQALLDSFCDISRSNDFSTVNIYLTFDSKIEGYVADDELKAFEKISYNKYTMPVDYTAEDVEAIKILTGNPKVTGIWISPSVRGIET